MTAPRRTDDPAVLGAWLRERLRPGDQVVWSQGAATPLPLIEQLVAVRSAMAGGSVLMSVGVGPTIDPVAADAVRLTALGALGSTRALAAAGVLEVVPHHLSHVPSLLAAGDLRADVVLVQVAPADEHGTHSLGLDAGYVLAAVERARVVVAEVNRRVPVTSGHARLPAARIDLVLETDRELPELAVPVPSEAERRLAAHVVDLVPDRAIVQFGIGSAPAAVAEALLGAADLGLHTGLLDDAQFRLVTAGVATGAHHPFTPGHAVAATLAGSRAFYDAAPAAGVLVREVTNTHGLATLARLPRFTAVNTAVEVDLTGQVNAESAGGRLVGGLGGLGDFLRGATEAPEGRSLVVLPAAARGGTSRIVPRLASGAVTVPRSDVDAVVTEHGVAHLRGATLARRAERLIAVAAPEHRDALARAWADAPTSHAS